MRGAGIVITAGHLKLLTVDAVRDSDVVITMVAGTPAWPPRQSETKAGACPAAISRGSSWSAGGKQGAGQDTVLDRAQLCPPFGLPLVYRPLAQQRHEVLAVGFPLVDPGPGHSRELDSAVSLGHLLEPGRVEQLPVRAGGRHRDRAVARCPAPLSTAESCGRVDGEKRRPPSGAEYPPACPQHGELGAQSTQHVGVHDCIKGGRRKGQRAGTARHRCGAGREVLALGAGRRGQQPFDRHVGQDGLAAGGLGKI
jgi:hypothetical protein